MNRFEVQRRIGSPFVALSLGSEARHIPSAIGEGWDVDRRHGRDRRHGFELRDDLIEKLRAPLALGVGRGWQMRSTSTRRSAASPRSIACRLRTVRISRPAAASTVTASATCATTSDRRPRVDTPPIAGLLPRSGETRSLRIENSPGARPASRAVTKTTATEQTATVTSMRIDSTRGNPSGTMVMSTGSATRPAGTRDARDHRQHEALGEHLAGDAATPRAERRTQRQLAAPALASHQEQVGDVGAGDQQDERDGAEERDHRPSHVADDDVDEGANDDVKPRRRNRWGRRRRVAGPAPRSRSRLVRPSRPDATGQ